MIDQQYTPLSPRRGQQNIFRAHSAQLEPAPSWVLPAGLRDMLPLFLDFSPDGLIMIDETGTIALVNTHVERLFGYGKEELIGQSLEILLPERFRATHAIHLARYMSDPHLRPMGVGLNLLGRRKDGGEFPVEISLQPIWIGQPLYVMAAVRDVTAQRKIQREREQLTERVRLQSELINLAHDAILVHDPDGYIVSWNQGAQDLYGWTEQEAVGQLTQRFLHTRFPQPLDLIEHSLEHEGHWQGDLVHTCRDGSQVVVESRWELVRDKKGAPAAFLEINRDVTERRRLEQIEQEARTETQAHLDALQVILDRLPTGIFLIQGPQLRLVLANRVARDLWGAQWQQGQSMEDFLSQQGVRLCSEDGRPLLPASTAAGRALASGEAISQSQAVIRRADGTSVPVLVNALPLDGLLASMSSEQADSEQVVLVVYQDVAALKEAEALKDQFISLATHELRTPVTVIAGYAEMLLRPAAQAKGHVLDAWQADKLHEIKQATQRLAKLTEDLLDVIRVQAGQFQLQPSATDLVALTRNMTEQLQATTDRHRLCVQATSSNLWAMVDAFRIEQVLTNLLNNAIKYSPRGGLVKVTLEEDTHMHEARFSVRDEGMGIPREQQARIFGRFMRADNARAAHISGTGLGLYLCRELIERHGGRMWFESNEGRGTTFFFVLPLPE